MFFKTVWATALLFFFYQTRTIQGTFLQPTDLLDDAKASLEDLNQIVLGHILVAHDEIDDLRFDLLSYRLDVRLNAQVDVEQERLTLEEELNNLKNLALSANKNISSCLGDYESNLNELPYQYVENIKGCITATETESNDLLDDARYHVDIVINNVQSLTFALGQCRISDTACISGIIDQIQTAQKALPLQIGTLVRNASEAVELVKVKVQSCADTGLAQYVTEATNLLGIITDCVDKIISLLFLLLSKLPLNLK